MELLTHSRQDAFKSCRRKHWYSYELGVRKVVDAKALRMGSAHHDAIEMLANGQPLETAVEAIRACYADKPEAFDQWEWDIERETLERLACAYQWRWQNDGLTYLAAEQKFRVPLVNPATGAKSKLFELGGMIDGIIQLQDSRLGVKESKLLGDDIEPDADLWRRMRIDHQVSLYVYAARQLGYAVDAVLYDVTRKPTIKPTAVPVIDNLGIKIVLDKHGQRVKTARGMWRQTGDTSEGYVLQTRPMTTDEWGDKLTNDIVARPDYYFARVEVPRLDQDVREYQEELWEIQKTLRQAQLNSQWFRTVNKNTCDFCSYFGICTGGWRKGDSLPEGFELVENVHPELGAFAHVNRSTETASPETVCAAACEVERLGDNPNDDQIF